MYLLNITLLLLTLNTPSEWKLEKDKDGIQVYTRVKEGYKLKEFKAITTLDVNINSAVALVRDQEVVHEWYNHVKSGESVEELDERRSIVYLHLDFPFPATDRDLIAKFDYSQDPETKVVNSVVVGVPDYLPEQDGLIRMKELAGSWKFIPLGQDRVQVEYQFYADPGGNLPVWAINMFIVDDPYKSLKRMQNYVKKDKYKDARFDFIKD